MIRFALSMLYSIPLIIQIIHLNNSHYNLNDSNLNSNNSNCSCVNFEDTSMDQTSVLFFDPFKIKLIILLGISDVRWCSDRTVKIWKIPEKSTWKNLAIKPEKNLLVIGIRPVTPVNIFFNSYFSGAWQKGVLL